jgi:hypothetical protein
MRQTDQRLPASAAGSFNVCTSAGGLRRYGRCGAGVLLALMAFAAGNASAQTDKCGASSGTPQSGDPCSQGGTPYGLLPPYLFNVFQIVDSHTLQQMANWSNSMLGLGTSNFLGKGSGYNTFGGSVYGRSWRDNGGTIIENGMSMPGSPTRTTSDGWELHDIYDLGRRAGLPDDQSLVIAGFANISQSHTRYLDVTNTALENDYSLSLTAAYRFRDYYVIGDVDGVEGRVHLDALHGDGTAGYSNKGMEGRIFVGRRIQLIDATTHPFALSADIGGYGAYLAGHSNAFTDSSDLPYGLGHAKSWLAGMKATLEAEIPHGSLLWSPYAGLTFDRYFAPHITVAATPYEGEIDYVGSKSLAGLEAGVSVSNASNLNVDLKAYSQQNSQLRTVGAVLTLSHPF